jgi:hypothetical protein
MSKKIERIHGRPMRLEPYKVVGNNGGCSVTIPKLAGLKPGEYVYIEKFDNGCILLVPAKIN